MLSLGSKKESGTLKTAEVAAAAEANRKAAEAREEAGRLPAVPVVPVDSTLPSAKLPSLSPKRLMSMEFVRAGLRASIPGGTPWSDVLQGSYWRNCSHMLRAGDILECVEDLQAWYGKLIVTRAYGHDIGVQQLEFVELDAEAPADLAVRSGFKIEDRGLTDKFCIVRLADGHTMKTGIETAALAQQEIHQTLVPQAQRRGFR